MKTCTSCLTSKPTGDFYRRTGNKDGREGICKSCSSVRDLAYRNRPEIATKRQAYRLRPEVKASRNAYHARPEIRVSVLEKGRVAHRLLRKRDKVLAFKAYGGVACACCGETEFAFLTIDHINGGGHQHRLRIGGSGSRLYTWLRLQGYPSGYRVLCMNCNWATRLGAPCPHHGTCKSVGAPSSAPLVRGT